MDPRTLRGKAAKSRRLALRASAERRTRRSEDLLNMAEELDRQAAEAEADESVDSRPVHPFVGAAPAAGSGASEAPLDDKHGKRPSGGAKA